MPPTFSRELHPALTFDDVLLVPQFSTVNSRSEVNLSTQITARRSLALPLWSANMDSVTGGIMAGTMANLGGIGVIHRYLSVDDQVQEVEVATTLCPDTAPIAAAIGAKDDHYGTLEDRAMALVSAGASILVIDIAHGDHTMTLKALERLKAANLGPGRDDKFVDIVAGNVATPGAVERLLNYGADAVKVGIGPGCFAAGTRILMANATYKNIEDIRAGDRVINMHGYPVTVKRAWCTGVREVMALRHTASFRETLVTSKHEFFVGDLSSQSPATVQSKGYAAALLRPTMSGASKLRWKHIGAAQSDVLLAPNRLRFELPEDFNIPLCNFAIPKDKQLALSDTSVTASYDLGYVFGTFLENGHAFIAPSPSSAAGHVDWSFSIAQEEVRAKLAQCLERVTGVRVTLTKGQTTLDVRLDSLEWARLLVEFGSRDPKHLPWQYMCQNPVYLRGLLEGLVDSNEGVSHDGRIGFRTTSPRLTELFNVLCHMVSGSFPNSQAEPCSTDAQYPDRYRSRPNATHSKRHMGAFQIIKPLHSRTLNLALPVYDLEIDCPSHSFIADNAVVHNSMCTTRIMTGHGVAQFTAILEAASVTPYAIADGGIRYAGDIVKALAAGASSVMLGSLLAGTDEAPGLVTIVDGEKMKAYRGMASFEAQNEFFSRPVDTPEGVATLVPYKGPADAVVRHLAGGLRSGCSYSGVHTVADLQTKSQWRRVTVSGLRESHAHGKS